MRIRTLLVTCYVFFRYFHYFERFGKKTRFLGIPDFDPDLQEPLNLHFGDGVVIHKEVSFRGRGTLRIGNFSSINSGVIFSLTCDMTIGDSCMIADRVSFRTADHAFSDLNVPMLLQGEMRAPITLQEDVWIGANVTVLRGVTIGKGAIVGANAVVNRDVEEYRIVGGVPAREIGNRHSKIREGTEPA